MSITISVTNNELQNATQLYLESKLILSAERYRTVTRDEINHAEALVKQCYNILLELDPLYKKILKKSKQRTDDSKVPPGSSLVKRSLYDPRFMLCNCCILLSIVSERRNDYSAAICQLLESLLWFPRSVQSIQRCAMFLKAFAKNSEDLMKVESMLSRAVAQSQVLSKCKNSIDDGTEFELTLSDMDYGRSSAEALALLLCQQDRFGEADVLLAEHGFTWRLSKQVLNYSVNSVVNENNESAESSCVCPHAFAYDNVIQDRFLSYLEFLFQPNSSFWREHDYDSILTNSSRKTGYFSYLYPLKDRSASCRLEELIDIIFKLVCQKFPSLQERAKYAEWWVHSRVHSSGHQLHFDSDETSIESGGRPAHPLVSCVLFVTADVGGPTLITDQLLQNSELARQGWMFHGRRNRLVMFDAKYLHGVIPGRGIPIAPSDCTSSSNSIGCLTPRRLTFMVGFWEHICARPRGLDMPGPGQPLPREEEGSGYNWIKELHQAVGNSDRKSMINNKKGGNTGGDTGFDWGNDGSIQDIKNLNSSNSLGGVEVIPDYVTSVWEPVGLHSVVLVESSVATDSLCSLAFPTTTSITTPGHNLMTGHGLRAPSYDECFQGF